MPTVFVYFPTHEALVREVLEEVARFFLEMTERVHGAKRPAPDIVVEHGRVFADAMVTHPDYARVLLEWSTALRDEVWPLYLQFHEKNIRIIARTIRRWRMETGSQRDPDAEDDARVIASTGYVLVQMKMANLPSRENRPLPANPGARHARRSQSERQERGSHLRIQRGGGIGKV